MKHRSLLTTALAAAGVITFTGCEKKPDAPKPEAPKAAPGQAANSGGD